MATCGSKHGRLSSDEGWETKRFGSLRDTPQSKTSLKAAPLKKTEMGMIKATS